MAINNFSLLQPNQPLTQADKLIADINNFNNTVMPNLPAPVIPPVNVPKYTKFGDNLATLGGFGDQPNELLAQEQLAKMTQDQVDAYNQQRKKARTQGIGELLMRFGDALQGKNASQLAYGRQQVRDLGDAKAAYQRAINIAEASGDFRKANLLRSLGLPGFQQLQQKRLLAQLDPKDRKIVLQNGIQYYADTGEPVLPNAPPPKPPKTTKSDFVVDILQKIKDHVPTEDKPTYELSESEQNILDTISATDPLEIYKRNIYSKIGLGDPFGDIPTIINEEDYKKLDDGDKFIFNGIEYTKGE